MGGVFCVLCQASVVNRAGPGAWLTETKRRLVYGPQLSGSTKPGLFGLWRVDCVSRMSFKTACFRVKVIPTEKRELFNVFKTLV